MAGKALKRAYLDYNASAPLLAEAREAMLSALDLQGNASAVHGEGRARRAAIEAARREIAGLCNAEPSRVVLTSGASESAAHLLTPDYRMGRSPLKVSMALVAATDHPCLREGGRFGRDRLIQLAVDGNGILVLDDLARRLAGHDSNEGLPLVACHYANNETGVIQPVSEIAGIVRQAGGIFIVDAVQAAGRVALDIAETGADFLILSSHKIGGPQGAGAIVCASDLLMPAPLIRGGGQEKGHRAGTENAAAIAGFGAAACVARRQAQDTEALRAMQLRFVATIRRLVPDARIIAEDAPRLANTILFTIPGMKAETAQIAFDLAGVALSAGSACSSGRIGDSHVLAAMGLGEIGSGLRLSFGADTGERELSHFAQALEAIVSRMQGGSRAA